MRNVSGCILLDDGISTSHSSLNDLELSWQSTCLLFQWQARWEWNWNGIGMSKSKSIAGCYDSIRARVSVGFIIHIHRLPTDWLTLNSTSWTWKIDRNLPSLCVGFLVGLMIDFGWSTSRMLERLSSRLLNDQTERIEETWKSKDTPDGSAAALK